MVRALLDWIFSGEANEMEFEKHLYVSNELQQFVPMRQSIQIPFEILLKTIC